MIEINSELYSEIIFTDDSLISFFNFSISVWLANFNLSGEVRDTGAFGFASVADATDSHFREFSFLWAYFFDILQQVP